MPIAQVAEFAFKKNGTTPYLAGGCRQGGPMGCDRYLAGLVARHGPGRALQLGQIGQQVCHSLHRNLPFQAFGHQ